MEVDVSGLPSLISKFDDVLQKLKQLEGDVVDHRIDGVITVALVGGRLDIRGLGSFEDRQQCAAILSAAAKELKGNKFPSPAVMEGKYREAVGRSIRVAQEVPLWRGGEEAPLVKAGSDTRWG